MLEIDTNHKRDMLGSVPSRFVGEEQQGPGGQAFTWAALEDWDWTPLGEGVV